MPAKAPAEPGLAGPWNAALAHKADVVAGAAGVRDDHDIVAGVAGGVEAASHGGHRWARIDGMDRRAGDRLGIHDAALAGDHQRAAGKAGLAEPPGQAVEIGEHQRLERGVDDCRRGAAILAQGGIEFVRQGDGDVRQVLGEQVADPPLMRAVDHRPQQADADGFDLQGFQPRDRGEHGRLVERLHHEALGINPLGHLKGQPPRHVGLGIGHAEVEGLHAPALTHDEGVGMPFGRQEGGSGRVAREDSVDGPRGAVHEHRRPLQEGVCARARGGRPPVAARRARRARGRRGSSRP